jgi:hypothetical protein
MGWVDWLFMLRRGKEKDIGVSRRMEEYHPLLLY